MNLKGSHGLLVEQIFACIDPHIFSPESRSERILDSRADKTSACHLKDPLSAMADSR